MKFTELTIYTNTLGSEIVGGIITAAGISCYSTEDPADLQALLDDSTVPYDYIEEGLLDKTDGMPVSELLSVRDAFAAEMTRCGAFLRHAGELENLYAHRHMQLAGFFSVHRAKDFRALKELFIDHDILLTQYVYIGAMLDYIRHGGISRGSAVYTQDTVDVLLAADAPQAIDTAHAAYVQETVFDRMTGEVMSEFVPVRPIPDAELWFENVYNRGKR